MGTPVLLTASMFGVYPPVRRVGRIKSLWHSALAYHGHGQADGHEQGQITMKGTIFRNA